MPATLNFDVTANTQLNSSISVQGYNSNCNPSRSTIY